MAQAPKEDSEFIEILTEEQYEALQDEMLEYRDCINNLDGAIKTWTCAVADDSTAGLPHREIMESVSPKLHILTSNNVFYGNVVFTLYASGSDFFGTLIIDTPELSVATELHYALIRQLQIGHSLMDAMEWLISYSPYANKLGQRGSPLVNRYY